MDKKTLEPTEIILKTHGQTYKVDNIDWDSSAEDLLEEFRGLMVASGFPPSILSNEYGRWEWHEYEEQEKSAF